MKSNFERNLRGTSTYECFCCHRTTRDTGIGEGGTELCAYCFEASGQENAYADGAISARSLAEVIRDLNKQYGKRAHIGCVAVVDPDPSIVVEAKDDIDCGPVVDALAEAKALRNAARKALRHAKAEGADEETVKSLRTASNAARRSYLQARKASK